MYKRQGQSTTAAPAENKTEAAVKPEDGGNKDAASGEEITLKIANYAILEAGYDTFLSLIHI